MKRLFAFFVVIAMATAFAGPSFAADWAFYGDSRMTTFWNDASRETTVAGLFDDEDLAWNQKTNSKIGANNIEASDTITARFEYGTGVDLRHLYGKWDFGVGKLLVDHTSVPVNFWPSNQVGLDEAGLAGFGVVEDGRKDMIRFRFGNLDIAFVEPGAPGGVLTAAAGAAFETDTSIPKLEARYNRTIGGLFFEIGAGYNTYDEVVTATDKEYDIDSWITYLGLTYDIGPITLAGNIFSGENLEDMGLAIAQAGDAKSSYNAALDRIEDNESWGGTFVVVFRLNDMLSFEAGADYADHELDYNNAATGEDDVSSAYIQAVIKPADGVSITPEFGYVDHEENGALADEGDVKYFGAMWQIAW